MTPGDNDRDRDAERDAWLRAALRHAPDAGAEPPAAVRDAILREARAASERPPSLARVGAGDEPPRARDARADVKGVRAPDGIGAKLAAFWDWLARPPVAAGFASVVAATVIGLMWWDRPLDSTIERPPPSAKIVAATPGSPPATTLERNAASALAGPRGSAPSTAAKTTLDVETRPAPAATPVSPAAPAAARAPATATRNEADRLRSAGEGTGATTPAQDRGKADASSPRAATRELQAKVEPLRRQSAAPTEEVARESRAAPQLSAPQAFGENRIATPPAATAPQTPPVAQAPEPALRTPAAPQAPAPDADLAKLRRAETRAAEKKNKSESENERTADVPASKAISGETADRRKDAPEPFPGSTTGAVQGAPRDRIAAAPARPDERTSNQATAPQAAVGAAPAAAGPPGAAARAPLLTALQVQVAAEPGRWTWSRDAGVARAGGDDLQAWLAQADAATRSAAADTRGDASAAADTASQQAADAAARSRLAAGSAGRAPGEAPTTLRFYRDGQLQATLRIDAAGVEITDAAGGVRRVPLDAAARAALRAALPR